MYFVNELTYYYYLRLSAKNDGKKNLVHKGLMNNIQ